MRISELSKRSGVALPTIKYYLREHLLAPGRATGANQADYDEGHLERLRLIRALVEIGSLSIATAREVLDAVDAEGMPLGHVFGVAQYAISGAAIYTDPASDASRDVVDTAIADRGWLVTADAPARVGAANVLDAFAAVGHPELTDVLADYLTAAEIVARADLRSVALQSSLADMATVVVAGTVLGDALFAAVRRLAQEHVTFEQYPLADAADPFGRGERQPPGS